MEAPLIPGAAFALLLGLECVVAAELFGRILERTDLQDLAGMSELSRESPPDGA